MSTISSNGFSADAGGDTTNGGCSPFLAYDNPNDTAQIIALAIATGYSCAARPIGSRTRALPD